jgi:hypothetical protein
MSYQVYRIDSLGLPRDHHAIFFETKDDGSGFIYQVSGTINEGMYYNHKNTPNPEASDDFLSKNYIGTTSQSNYPLVQEICERIEPPKKQIGLNGRRLYPGEPLRRCQEWTAEVIEALKDAGVIET